MVEQFFGAPLRRSQKTAPFEFPVAAAYSAGAALRLNDVVKNCSETVSNLAVSRAAPEPQIWPLDGCKCSAPAPLRVVRKNRSRTRLEGSTTRLCASARPSASHGPSSMVYSGFSDRTGAARDGPATRAHGSPFDQRAKTRAMRIGGHGCDKKMPGMAGDCLGMARDGQGWPGMARDGLGWSGRATILYTAAFVGAVTGMPWQRHVRR